jgi:biopolymer transport protein ExbD
VLFILLIFFALSSTFTKQPHELPVQTPSSEISKKSQATVTVSLTEKLDIYYLGEKVSEKQLRVLLRQALLQDSSISVLLNADKRIAYEDIISILDDLKNCGYNVKFKLFEICVTD